MDNESDKSMPISMIWNKSYFSSVLLDQVSLPLVIALNNDLKLDCSLPWLRWHDFRLPSLICIQIDPNLRIASKQIKLIWTNIYNLEDFAIYQSKFACNVNGT